MKWLPATAFAILTAAASCGNGQSRVESPTPGDGADGHPEDLDTFHGDSADKPIEGGATSKDPWADELERPAGVKPIAAAAFASFLGFDHGATMKQIISLLPEEIPKLGKRAEMDMAGSVGYKYEGHLAAAWDDESKRIEFLSVRSKEAIRYLADHGHSDEKLDVVWALSPGGAHGILGKPTQVVNRPHAVTYRYEFSTSDKRRGTVSIEFSKLAEPVRCSAVSVHWFY